MPQIPRLYPDEDPTAAPLPEEGLLDSEDAKILSAITDTSSNFGALRRRTQSRIEDLQSSLEFKIDHLADSVHKLDQRMITAGREADRVLGLSARRLKEREDKEKGSAGTKELPTMEVLRSLGRILPEGGA